VVKKFKGVFSALITPFENGDVDFPSLKRLVEFQIDSGINGFVINGTTAESPTLTETEREKIFRFVRECSPANFPLIMGTGSNSTAKTIEESRQAEKMGADGILVVVPYYNKPPQRGLLEHFKAIADATQIPNILYNVPSRTITFLELETIKKLSEHPNIYGIKEASGNIELARQMRQLCGESFILLSGDDASYDDFMAAGGDGVISVASMVIPEAMLRIKTKEHRDLIDMLFVEANPIPLKKALQLMGIIKSPECRLPLVTLADVHTEKLKKLMKHKGFLK
jgi:4-hydroxy-tetrahydrodipicolinate synthase